MIKRNANQRKATPRGMTLIETVIFITLTAALSGIVVTGMAALFRYNRAASSRHVGQTAMQQMTTRLRADIHAATRCLWNAESQSLRLELPEARILEYQPMKKRWVRVLTAGEAKPVTTSFGLDDSFRWYCQTEQTNRGELIRLILMNQPHENLKAVSPENGSRTERTLRSDIVAQVGRNYFSLPN